jgi:phosphoglycolate phosphatase-like HAD superfamily hydrolase
LLGVQTEFDGIKTAGMTDYYIAGQIIHTITGRAPVHRDIMQLINRYEKLLPAYLEIHSGYLLPSVYDILTALQDHPAFTSLLLTGNTSTGARSKLSYLNIAHYFDFTRGAFCSDCRTRREVAAQAKKIVHDNYPHTPRECVFVIGDTPHDIDCGKFVDMQTIAVATGAYDIKDLAAHKPWWALQTLPSPEEFIEKLTQRS